MLQIYDYLVDVIQKHLKKRQIDAEVKPHIGRAWHCYRFIQVRPKEITDYVHYEYINGRWELHFENSNEDAQVERLRRKVMSQINSDGYIDWHRREGNQKGYLSVDEVVENCESFLSIFDDLWDATSDILLNDVEEIESNVPEEQDDLMEDEVVPDSYEFMESVINNDAYQDPVVRLSTVEDLPFERFVIPPY